MVVETTISSNVDGSFISLWQLLEHVGKAESVYADEAAHYLTRCFDINPIGINYLRRRDESGILLPMELGARIHLLHQISMFASQGALLDIDDRPTDDAQPTFERVGFYTSDIYPFLTQHDVAISLRDGETSERKIHSDGRELPEWLIAFDSQNWLSRSRAAKVLMAVMYKELQPSQFDDLFFKWDAALSDAIERGMIRVAPSKGMLSHDDIGAWCMQHGYVWPLDMPNQKSSDGIERHRLVEHQMLGDSVSSSDSLVESSSLKRREQQVRVIEVMADQLGYSRLKIPDGGKQKILILCKSQHVELFGGGDSPFEGAWKAARKANRIMMANHGKFTSR